LHHHFLLGLVDLLGLAHLLVPLHQLRRHFLLGLVDPSDQLN
jgi:hypothetical protein